MAYHLRTAVSDDIGSGAHNVIITPVPNTKTKPNNRVIIVTATNLTNQVPETRTMSSRQQSGHALNHDDGVVT